MAKEDVTRFIQKKNCDAIQNIFLNNSKYDPQFTNNVVEEFMNKLTIKHCITTTYNPNMNSVVEFTNKVLCNILHNEMKNVKTWTIGAKKYILWGGCIISHSNNGFAHGEMTLVGNQRVSTQKAFRIGEIRGK